MNHKIRTVVLGLVGIALFGGVVYQGILFASNRFGGALVGPAYEIVLPTQWPARQSDMEGIISEVRDNSVFVGPIYKALGSDQEQQFPPVEVVIGTTTEIYLDQTDRNHPTIEDGKFYWVLTPFNLEQIEVGYVMNAWGVRRGDRIIADTVIIYIIPTEENRN
jgi:hypothetical protein